MLYYDSKLDQAYTEAGLRQRGLRTTKDSLSAAGIYPLECAPPEHDQALYVATPTAIVPAGPGLYRQEFELTPRPLEEARAALKGLAGANGGLSRQVASISPGLDWCRQGSKIKTASPRRSKAWNAQG